MPSTAEFPATLLDVLPDALVVTDDEHWIVFANQGAGELFGYPAEDLVGLSILTLLPQPLPENRDGISCRAWRSDRTELEVLATVRTAEVDGARLRLVSLRPAGSRTDGPIVEEEAELFRRALRSSPVVVGTVDRDLRYTWVYNPHPHFPLEQAIGKRDDELTSGEGVEELMAFKREVLATGEHGERTIEFHLRDEIRTYEIVATPITNEHGEVIEVTTVSIDTSHLRRMMRFQREFVGMIAHDLRQPITAVQIWAERMLRQRAYDELALEEIVAQTHRLGRMVEDLLDTTAIESGNLQLHPGRFDLVPVVRYVVDYTSDLSRMHRIQLEARGQVLGHWDQGRVIQVVENILVNAIKYSPPDSEIRVQVTADDGAATVSVTDQGMGLSAEDMTLIFDCFGRTPAARKGGVNGLGLGLCIARGIVEAHGGRLTASSEGPGTGSTFSFTLPFQPPSRLI